LYHPSEYGFTLAESFEMPATGNWAAIFIAFQTESWDTDENGNPA